MEYYVYLHFFLDFATKNNLKSETVKNPLLNFSLSQFSEDSQQIVKYYNSFGDMIDVVRYFLDYVWDYIMILNGRDPHKYYHELGYDNRLSLMVNHINQIKTKDCFGILEKKINILNLIKEISKKGLILLDKWKKEVKFIKKQMSNILYRNKQKPKLAWIRKLVALLY